MTCPICKTKHRLGNCPICDFDGHTFDMIKFMKQVSTKQAEKNRELARIKKELIELNGDRCMICRTNQGTDLMHLLPKSIWPEHYTAEWNFIIGCRSCHDIFDSSAAFRRRTGLYKHVAKYDPQGAYRYFQMGNAENDL